MGVTSLNSTLNHPFTISNTGEYALTLDSSFVTGGSSDISIQSPTFPLTLAKGATQTIMVQCTPKDVGGLRSRTLTLTSVDTPNLQPSGVSYTFECTGDAAVAQFSPSSGSKVNLGKILVGGSASSKIGVMNNNGVGSSKELTLGTATLTGDTSVFSFTQLTGNIAANATDSSRINVKCDATSLTTVTAITGTTYTATLKVGTNDPHS